MKIINGIEYFDIYEVSDYMKLKQKSIIRDYSDGKHFSVIRFDYDRYEYYFNKQEVIYYNDNVRNIINYQKIVFNGKIEKINDKTYLLDDVEFRSSDYIPDIFISKNADIVYKLDRHKEFRKIPIFIDKNYDKHISMPKSVFLHRLLLESFGYPKPFPNAVVRHLNDDKNDLSLDNLKWGTLKENRSDYRKILYINKKLFEFLKIQYPDILNNFKKSFEPKKYSETKNGKFILTKDDINIEEI